MVNFTILQVVLLTLLAFIKHVDYYGIPMIFVNYAVFWGLITGVVMGDWQTGLVIGGTIQPCSSASRASAALRSPTTARWPSSPPPTA